MIKVKESDGKYFFGKNIIFDIIPAIFLISINILFILFSYFFVNFAEPFTKFVRTNLLIFLWYNVIDHMHGPI